MIIKIITVHPSVTMVDNGGRQFELPTTVFPTPPQVGQTWDLGLKHLPTPGEQVAKLNDYLTST